MEFIFHLHMGKNNPYNFALESGSHLTNPHIAPLTSTFHVFPQRFSLSFQMLAWRRRLSQSSSLGRREGRPEAVGVTNKIIASSEGLVMPRAKRFLRNKKLRKLFKDLKTSWTEKYLLQRHTWRGVLNYVRQHSTWTQFFEHKNHLALHPILHWGVQQELVEVAQPPKIRNSM